MLRIKTLSLASKIRESLGGLRARGGRGGREHAHSKPLAGPSQGYRRQRISVGKISKRGVGVVETVSGSRARPEGLDALQRKRTGKRSHVDKFTRS